MYRISIPSLNGKLNIIPSKSDSHRALFCALLAQSVTKITNISMCDDIKASVNVLKKAGCLIKVESNNIIVDSTSLKYDGSEIDCMDSATTLRLAIPIFIHLFSYVKVTGSKQLERRPLNEYFKIFDVDQKQFPIKFSGNIKDQYVIDGSISSQFVSGLILVLPLQKFNSKIVFLRELESKGYVEMTMDTMRKFGVKISDFNIKGNQAFNGCEYVCEEDYSNFAFFYIANLLGGNIKINSMPQNSKQPDRAIIDIVKKNDSIIDLKNTPDLLPILALYACFRKEQTKFVNIRRTMIKESNRVKSISEQLNKLGAKINYNENEMIVEPVETFRSKSVSACDDHRIAMTLIIAALHVDYIEIDNIKCIDKSYPTFIDEIKKLGGNICLV